jgi:hypothetical protein
VSAAGCAALIASTELFTAASFIYAAHVAASFFDTGDEHAVITTINIKKNVFFIIKFLY